MLRMILLAVLHVTTDRTDGIQMDLNEMALRDQTNYFIPTNI